MGNKAPKFDPNLFRENLLRVQNSDNELSVSPSWGDLKTKFDRIITSDNFRLYRNDTRDIFGIEIDNRTGTVDWKNNTDRQRTDYFVTYYGMCIGNAGDKGKGLYITALGNDTYQLIQSVSEQTGIITGTAETNNQTAPAPDPIDTAQKKTDMRKQATNETTKAGAIPKVDTTADSTQNNSAQNNSTQSPTIGTPFLASNMQFVLYKPSEAYLKPERQSIIKNYFYADTITILYGQAGSFKTFYAIWEGLALVLGKEVCGMDIEPNTDPQKVLYISLEMSAKDISDRITRMTKNLTNAERQLIDENFTIISAEDTANMKASNVSFMESLEELCKSEGYNVIYIDSFADYSAGFDVRSEHDMTSVIDALRVFTLNNHVSFRIIHHGTKPTQDTNGSMAGIHTIRDLVDHVFLIKATVTQEVKITSDMQTDRSAKSRYGEPTSFSLQFVSDADSFSFKRIQDSETSSHIALASRIISEIKLEQGITTKDLRNRCGNNKNFTNVLSGMIGNTVIVDIDNKKKGSAAKHCYTADYWMSTHP